MEKDQVDRELREKETRILTMQRELEDLQDRLEESERQRSSQSRELQDLVASKDDVGKNVFELERAKNSLEVQEKQLRQQLEELEEELAVLEATRDRLEVNMGAMKGEYERELNAKEDQLEDIRRTLGKQVIRSVALFCFVFYIISYRLYLLSLDSRVGERARRRAEAAVGRGSHSQEAGDRVGRLCAAA